MATDPPPTAEEVFDRVLSKYKQRKWSHPPYVTIGVEYVEAAWKRLTGIPDEIRAAVEAQKEKDARIAKSKRMQISQELEPLAWNLACDKIAAAIRGQDD